MKKFAAFDIDGTLFRSGLYREVVHELVKMGALPESVLSRISDKQLAWQQRAHGNAFAEFDQAVVDELGKELPRLKVAYLDLAAENVMKAHKDNVYVYTRDLVSKLKKDGYFLIAISGSQYEAVEPFAQHYGFNKWIGNMYERGEDFFTGHMQKTHVGKGKFLKKIIDEENLSMQDSIAIGDSAGDIEMLEMVQNPIAFNPERKLFETASKAGWKIVLERKNMIYELEEKDGEYKLHKADSH